MNVERRNPDLAASDEQMEVLMLRYNKHVSVILSICRLNICLRFIIFLLFPFSLFVLVCFLFLLFLPSPSLLLFYYFSFPVFCRLNILNICLPFIIFLLFSFSPFGLCVCLVCFSFSSSSFFPHFSFPVSHLYFIVFAFYSHSFIK